MVDAVLLDFYGTVVHEDKVVNDQICRTISQSASVQADPKDIGKCWWSIFSDASKRSYGDDFRSQRRLELESLNQTIENFGAECDADDLSAALFDHWERSPIFDDALRFLADINLPIVVVSNIDRGDIETAIAHHGLAFDHVITSEDVRSYKPRPELFVAGLDAISCSPDRVLHVGDSLVNDVAGAHELQIPVAWINRADEQVPNSQPPTYEVTSLEDLIPIVRS